MKNDYFVTKINPTIQITIPKTCFKEIFSLYATKPTISSVHARQIFATTEALLTFHPARYIKI